MGSDICTCLNDLTGGESEDLSNKANENDNIKKEKKKPEKIVTLHKDETLDSVEPLQSIKENNSISTNLNSDYKNTMLNHQQRLLKKNLQSKKNNNDNKDNKIKKSKKKRKKKKKKKNKQKKKKRRKK